MTETTAALTCPKCGGQMRNYERNGIVLDQCSECRGIFLDRGELERLVDAENAYYGGGAGTAPAGSAPTPLRREYDRDVYERRDYVRDRDPRYAGDDRYDNRFDDDDDRFGRGRRGGFLGGLLDFD